MSRARSLHILDFNKICLGVCIATNILRAFHIRTLIISHSKFSKNAIKQTMVGNCATERQQTHFKHTNIKQSQARSGLELATCMQHAAAVWQRQQSQTVAAVSNKAAQCRHACALRAHTSARLPHCIWAY